MSDAGWIDAARYYVAVVWWVALPAAVVFWLVIHPFAAFWRRVGLVVTYSTAAVAMALAGWIAWQFRLPALEVRQPLQPVLAVVGVALYVLALRIEVLCRRHLKARTLVGVPEVKAGDPGKLLTEGIYAHTRNPRYLDIMIAMVGWALLLQIGAFYWMVLAGNAGIYLIAVIEERELAERFGAPYEAYRDAVPRLVPRSWAFLSA